jgi:hypothetical protein
VSSFTYTADLEFRHPRTSPDQVTASLKLTPERCWDKGSLRTTPQGELLAGRHAENYWRGRWFEGYADELSLARTLSQAVDRAVAQKDFFQDYVATGGLSAVNLFWTPHQIDVDLPFELLARLADFRLSLILTPMERQY